jgi:hypothetical protein
VNQEALLSIFGGTVLPTVEMSFRNLPRNFFALNLFSALSVLAQTMIPSKPNAADFSEKATDLRTI